MTESFDIVAALDALLAEQGALHVQLRLHRLADWQALYEQNVRLAARYGPASRAMGWRETERAWNDLHPEIIPPTLCAGCRQPLAAGPVITRDMGHPPTQGHYRFHEDDRRFCLEAFHEHRRLTARRALIELGLEPPR